ncbi:hypothetical protein M231_04395 [Tremella mesenterica]|uniref:Uncharacterized protein n=1 Tax=Tremella mesenterica TaxID=5217 RepID=A0A4Q1BKQ5_TREME|nr:hypothetical protein M231_04395 [Tremella mesenterica]
MITLDSLARMSYNGSEAKKWEGMTELINGYGFQTSTKLRLVISVALVDAMIKDADIVAIFRAVLHLLLQTSHNPFLSLPQNFLACHVPPPPIPDSQPLTESDPPQTRSSDQNPAQGSDEGSKNGFLPNPSLPTSRMFSTTPEDLKAEWFNQSEKFRRGIEDIGILLSGGRWYVFFSVY